MQLMMSFVGWLILFSSLSSVCLAQTVTTYTSKSAYDAALPGDAETTLEDFSSISSNYTMSDSGDQFNGILLTRIGTGSYGNSKYCSSLSMSGCITWNGSAPSVPGVYGSFGTGSAGVTITPDNEIYAIAFDTVDWNDGSYRSDFVINFSNGSNVTINGPLSQPIGFFGYVLDSTSISAGIHIDSIVWDGYASSSEVVGIWNIETAYEPEIAEVQLAGSSITTNLGANTGIMDAGDTATFNVTFTNSTSNTIGTVTIASALGGAVVCPSSGGSTITNIAASAIEVCTITYTITQGDFDGNGGGDGDLDDTVTATYNPGSGNVVLNDNAALAITQVSDLTVTKTAVPKVNVPAGQDVTYTYSVTNTGNLTISNISLSDLHNASGPNVVPDNETLVTPGGSAISVTTSDASTNKIWDSLGPGDVVEFSGRYTVTQNDVDTLQ